MKIHLVVVVGVADQLIWSGWGDHKAASGRGAVPRRIQPHKQCAIEIGVVFGCHWTYIPSLSGDWASPWKCPLAWSWWKRSTKLDQTSNFHGRVWALSGQLYIYIILFFFLFYKTVAFTLSRCELLLSFKHLIITINTFHWITPNLGWFYKMGFLLAHVNADWDCKGLWE